MSIEKAYNTWATQYDSNKNQTRDLDQKATIETLSKYNFEKVLELGCGTGKNTEWLIKNTEMVIGLDFSAEMLRKAKEKIYDERATFQRADLNQDWEVKNDDFDLITSSLTLEHIHDLNHIFNQAKLKLQADGLFFVSELHPFKQYTGSKAKFDTDAGTQELETFVHHVSEFTELAFANGFELIELKEWFDDKDKKGHPRLISFVFKKEEIK